MAGSYSHATTDDGRLRNTESMGIATETQGDAYETIEEMYGMIWFLAARITPHEDPEVMAALVENARVNYKRGLELSPGKQPEEE